jgi:hypothetical protein
MAYFEDLSDYDYLGPTSSGDRGKSVGWLERGYRFDTARPSEELLEALWRYCKISVRQTRGIHSCDFCKDELWYIAERNGEKLIIGSSEIRVFSKSGTIYAAPTLLYHYVESHNYSPPEEFVRAVLEEPDPAKPSYFSRLEELGIAWNATSVPGANPGRVWRFKSPQNPLDQS